ncbi:hypothetical protein [Glycomyces tenuis]|uniref:hypothetical protein n=1 Tax=Glycomyces tenuis TaxID=58116 RepID=UPI000422401D|nr:hypothetical protein [Glycomyces tenuis]
MGLLIVAWTVAMIVTWDDGGEVPVYADPAEATDLAGQYLRFGSDGDPEQAEEALCEGASPEVTPAELVELRESHAAAFDGETLDVRLSTGSAEYTDGTDVDVDAVLTYTAGDHRPVEEAFVASLRVEGEEYCVFDVVSTGPPEPTTDDVVAATTDFLYALFDEEDAARAAEWQCPEYSGMDLEAVVAAIQEFEEPDSGSSVLYLVTTPSGTDAGSGLTMFEVEVTFSDPTAYPPAPPVATELVVDGDCVAEYSGASGPLEGADG